MGSPREFKPWQPVLVEQKEYVTETVFDSQKEQPPAPQQKGTFLTETYQTESQQEMTLEMQGEVQDTSRNLQFEYRALHAKGDSNRLMSYPQLVKMRSQRFWAQGDYHLAAACSLRGL